MKSSVKDTNFILTLDITTVYFQVSIQNENINKQNSFLHPLCMRLIELH